MSDLISQVEGLLLIQRDFFAVYSLGDVSPQERTILSAVVAETYMGKTTKVAIERVVELTGFTEIELRKALKRGAGYVYAGDTTLGLGTRWCDLTMGRH